MCSPGYASTVFLFYSGNQQRSKEGMLHWSYSTGQFRGALSIRGAHFVFGWYFTKFRGAQKMSGEMLVISFVREVNHVIMAATLDRRQNPQIQL